jgi:hypothetical protein
MDPATISMLLGLLLKYGPDVYKSARKLISGTPPTEADWAELDTILAKTGESYFTKAGG